MKKNTRATLNVSLEKKMELEKAAIDLSYKIGKSVGWTDIAHYMLNNYVKLAKEDLIDEAKGKNLGSPG